MGRDESYTAALSVHGFVTEHVWFGEHVQWLGLRAELVDWKTDKRIAFA
jgi:hypothetical protein